MKCGTATVSEVTKFFTMAKKKVLTKSLDAAAYLVSLGYTCSIRRLGIISAEFTFSAECALPLAEFQMGQATVNLANYLYSRSALKVELKGMRFYTFEETPSEKPVNHISVGTPYWYVAMAQSPVILHAIFSDREPHLSRLREKNIYLTRAGVEEAVSRMRH